MDALVASTHAATRSSRPTLRAGDRVTDAYCLRVTGTVAYVGTAHDGTREVPTANVNWDGPCNRLHGYAQDTLRLIWREGGIG